MSNDFDTDLCLSSSSPSTEDIHRSSFDSDDSNKENVNNNQQQQLKQTKKTTAVRAMPVNRSKKAGLIFSVSRVENHLRQGRYAERLSKSASVYLAGVLEYLVAETVELAGDITHQSRKKRITPRHISLAIQNDDELAKLCTGITIPEGGVRPHIHQVLLGPIKKRRRNKNPVNYNSASSNQKKQKTASKNQQQSTMDMDTDNMDDSN